MANGTQSLMSGLFLNLFDFHVAEFAFLCFLSVLDLQDLHFMLSLTDHFLYILGGQFHFLFLILKLSCLLKILLLHLLNVRKEIGWLGSVLLELTGFQIYGFCHLAQSKVIKNHKTMLFELFLLQFFELFSNLLQLLLGLCVLVRQELFIVGQIKLLLNLFFLRFMNSFCVYQFLSSH